MKPGPAFYYGQLLIIGIIFLFNVAIFALIAHRLIGSASEVRDAVGERKRDRIIKRLQNLGSIWVLLGLTWGFGLLTVFEASYSAFQVIFAVLSSLQGLFIFLLFVVRQEKIREYVSNVAQGKKAKYLSSSSTSKSALSTKHNLPTKNSSQDGSQLATSVYENPVFKKEDKDVTSVFDNATYEVANKAITDDDENGVYEDLNEDSGRASGNDIYKDMCNDSNDVLQNSGHEDLGKASCNSLENDVCEVLNKGEPDAFENGTYEISKNSVDTFENDVYETMK